MIQTTVGYPINLDVLSRECRALDTGIIVEGQTITFLNTDDQAGVDVALVAYQQAMAERDAIINAFQANQAFLDLASPTQVQAVAQVKALTRQMNGLVQLLNRRGLLD
jgi:hypothetical protein